MWRVTVSKVTVCDRQEDADEIVAGPALGHNLLVVQALDAHGSLSRDNVGQHSIIN